MNKVLFITNYPSPYRVDFFNELGRYNKIDLSVVFIEGISEQGHRSAEWFHEDYDYFTPIFLKKRTYLTSQIYICKEIIDAFKTKYDEIIFGGYNYPTMMYAMLYLKFKKIPYCIEIDGGFVSEKKGIRNAVKRYFVSSASKWYSTGEVSDRYFLEYGAKKEYIFHYPFSSLKQGDIDSHISETEYEKRKQLIRRELGISEERVVLSIGQFIRRKGIDVLLNATQRLPRDIGVYIIGGTPKEEYLNFVNEHGLTNVHFLDFQGKQKLKKYYLSADVFALPTREDIWGLVINEAMAYGVPAITTNKCIAGLQLITKGENGYIVPVEDDEQLAQRIADVLNSDLYKMRKYCLSVAKEYTIEKMALRHVEIICGENNEKTWKKTDSIFS